MNFAALASMTNASVLRHLANVVVTISGEPTAGIFERPASVADLGIGAADSQPNVTIESAKVPLRPVGITIEIDSVPYSVTSAAPDGTGLTVLRLECLE